MIKGRFAGIAGLLAAGTVCAGLIAPAFSASPTKPVISQGASVAMIQMAQTLRSTHFSFRARTLRVYVGTGGRFLHIGHALKVVVRRPDRLRTTIDGDDGVPAVLRWQDARAVSPGQEGIRQRPVPDTIEGMFKEATNRMGFDFPLADFLSPAPNKAIFAGVTDGRVVKDVTIDGVLSHHLTLFQPPGLELEIWLTKKAIAA